MLCDNITFKNNQLQVVQGRCFQHNKMDEGYGGCMQQFPLLCTLGGRERFCLHVTVVRQIP